MYMCIYIYKGSKCTTNTVGMCIYIYIYIYKYSFSHIYTYIYEYTYSSSCIYIYVYTYMYIYMYSCTNKYTLHMHYTIQMENTDACMHILTCIY